MTAVAAGAGHARADGPAVWVDVEDFYEYFAGNRQPSGIQRVAFEIMRELAALAGPHGTLRFLRRGTGRAREGKVVEVAWEDVARTYAAPPALAPVRPDEVLRRFEDRLKTLPPELHTSLRRARTLQIETGKNVRALLGAARPTPLPGPAAPEPDAPLQAGDWLLEIGAPWMVQHFPRWLEAVKARHGIRAALLVYDLVPARHPEWCAPELVTAFNRWLGSTLPLCEQVLALSRHTAADVLAFARERAIALPGTVEPIIVGTGFRDTAAPEEGGDAAWLPAPGSYVLFVSTLEARKNHALAVRVWRRLSEEVRTGVRTAESLPMLVFAGRVGWLVKDLVQQLDNASWLRGRIRLIREPSDAELRRLYAGCLFTLFPSLFEGWGLPVSESLVAGKPCLSSDAAALPEAGGALGRYFDPLDVNSAHRAVAALLDDRPGIAAWQEQVRCQFSPVPWSRTATDVLGRLDGVQA